MHHSGASDPVTDEYSRLAERYDRRWSVYIRATVAETARRAAVCPGEAVLDVGCGTGALLRAILDGTPGVTIAGIDPCGEMLAVARKKLPGGSDLRESGAESLPFPDGSFDVVVSTSAFHYFRAPAAALAEMKRVLKPGGRIVITDWCHDYFTCRLCDFVLRRFNRAHFRTYRAAECRDLLAAAGFTATEVHPYRISWFWGLMTARAGRDDARIEIDDI